MLLSDPAHAEPNEKPKDAAAKKHEEEAKKDAKHKEEFKHKEELKHREEEKKKEDLKRKEEIKHKEEEKKKEEAKHKEELKHKEEAKHREEARHKEETRHHEEEAKHRPGEEGKHKEELRRRETKDLPARDAAAKQLDHFKFMLEKWTDHDYDGHRSAAVRNLGKAISVLAPNMKFGDTDRGGKRERQGKSDAVVREALSGIRGALSRVARLHDPESAKAAGHVRSAIKDLEVALKDK